MKHVKDLEGVYDINVYLDEAHYDETRDRRYKIAAYPTGVDEDGYHTYQTHKPIFEGVPLAVPHNVDIYDVLPDADDTWFSTDSIGVPDWIIKQAEQMIENTTGVVVVLAHTV